MSSSNSGVLVRGELSIWYAIGVIAGILAIPVGIILVLCQLPVDLVDGAANFFPGFYLLTMMTASGERPA